MGLIRAGQQTVKSFFGDQWREYFYCDSMDTEVLLVKGLKKASKGSSNTKGSDNIISNGSIVAVNEGQCMLIVDQGRVAEVCCEAGEFIYDSSAEPSLFFGNLGENVRKSFEVLGRRFSFGGDTARDQRVYFVNTKEIIGNKYGTVNPVPYRVVDQNIGLDMEISIRCHGEYSYHIVDPVLFYTNVCGNAQEEYRRENMESQLRSELLTQLQTAFARVSDQGVRYYQLTGHTMEIAEALNEALTEKWRELRGIEIVSFGISGVKAPEEDEALIKELQRTAVFRNPAMAAATLADAKAEAMKAAAANTSAGPMMAFAGMNMAQMAGGQLDMGDLFQMAQNNQAQTAGQAAQMQSRAGMAGQAVQLQPGMENQPSQGQAGTAADKGWACACGKIGNTGNFCTECGKPKAQANGWTCSCGTVNKGKFCMECGQPKPASARQYACDKCGWEPEDPAHPPKFCPECGDPFDDNDVK